MVPKMKAATTFLLTAGFLLSFSIFAQPETIDLSTRGPQIDDTLPEFSLPDQNGELWTQESILGENGTMLVFLRSADW
jgi:hypothetical protein